MQELKRQRQKPKAAIIHFGLGAFFRAHGALIIEKAMHAAGGDWGVIGVSLRTSDICNRLAGQDHVYTAVEMGETGRTMRRSEILSDVIFAPDNPEQLLAQMSDPAIKILSLTITEKGYCHIPSTGALDTNHPEIKQDILSFERNDHPITAIGYIVKALQKRMYDGSAPFTILSCDNLPHNGEVARRVILDFAMQIDQELADWIAREACFPGTMVDRIVPAVTAEDIEALEKEQGVRDQAPVFHEPFCQWVIEDKFVNSERPEFEQLAGVELVDNVTPFEVMKLRMLNGTHSALAYLGYLSGYDTISDTVADPVLRQFVLGLWEEEIIPTLESPGNSSLSDYAAQLLGRYDNPAMKHRTWQIAMDGSQKLPQRILNSISQNDRDSRPSHRLILAIAAWILYVGGVDLDGNPIDVKDPLADRLRVLCDEEGTSAERIARFLQVEEVFDITLSERLQRDLTSAYDALVQMGPIEAAKLYWCNA